MNYIYDITLNLNRNNYEFYEWKDDDNPEFVLKIPVYKVDNNMYYDIKNNDIIIDKKFLEQILEKTEVYSPNTIGIIRYACLFASEYNVIAIEFDSDGNNYMKSSLSLDEEDEILEITKNIKYSLIEYKIKSKKKIQEKYITRIEFEKEKSILKKIETIKSNKEFSKLKYIFFELYNEKLDDPDKVYNKLINIVKNDSKKLEKMCDILNLTENGKIMSNNS